LPGGGPVDVPPQTVAGFEVLGELGRGGRTVTYRVRRHTSIYAMKILQRRGEEESPHRAFCREAALLASVNDPGLVRVHEVGTADGQPYLIMDYVDGQSLTSVLADGRLPVVRIAQIGIDVARALGAAHRARLVHRDVKPANIMVSADGAARVIDFGLAVRPGDVDETTTAGTLLYCAPEQAGMLHRPVDGRADLYALGAVLYECATGQPPFSARDLGELMRLHATAAPPDPRLARPDLPPALAAVILRLLAKDPDDRYQSATGVAADLARIAAGETDFALGTADHAQPRQDHPLTGRDTELSALMRRWEAARGGPRGGVAVVEGAAGSGKTRLAREVAALVRGEGGLALTGECEPEQGMPLAPLRRAVDDHLAAIAAMPPTQRAVELDRVRAAVGPGAALLRGLSPALDALLDAPGLPDEDRHQQFPIAVASFLAALTDNGVGSVLHLDDVHWLDDATLRVLSILSERLPDLPLLVLATGRDGPPSAAVMGRLRSTVGPTLDLTVALRPLRPEVIGGLVSSATGGLVVDDATATSLAARSDGNTFTLLQYLDAVLDAGLLRPDWGRWQLDTDHLNSVRLADDLILRRLDGLDPDSRYVLGVGAVYGSVFDPGVVAAVCALTRSRMLEVADAAAWRNLIERREGGRYAFPHDRIRAALLDQFYADALSGVHQRIADVLEAAGDQGPEAVFALARHCLAGDPEGHPERVYRACHAAGQLALADHAPLEALSYLERAGAAAEHAALSPDFAFLFLLATAQQRAGRFGDAIRTAEVAHRRATSAFERARALSLSAQALDTAWESEGVTDVVQRALGELGRAPSTSFPVLALSTLWTVLVGQTIRFTRIGRGRARGRKRDLYRLESNLYSAGAWAFARQMKPLHAVLFRMRQTLPVVRIGVGPEETRMRLGLTAMNMAMGRIRAGRRQLTRARAAAHVVGDPMLSGTVAWIDGFTSHTYGLDQGERLRRVQEEHGRWLEVGLQSDLTLVLAWDAVHRGQIREAQRVVDLREGLLKLVGQAGGEATARFEHGTAARGIAAALLAWQDNGEKALALLGLSPDETRSDWERLPVRGTAMVVAYEMRELGDVFDRAVAEFDALTVPIRVLIPLALGYYATRSLGRLDQCRLATGVERAVRLEQATNAVRLQRRTARIPVLRAHYEVAYASLMQVRGQPKAALRHLARVEPTLLAVDAPAVAFEAARVRAFALRDLRVLGESERQAQAALAIALEQDWRHRARRTAAEFGLGDPPSVPDLGIASTNEAIALSRFRQRLDAIEQLGLAASRVLDPVRLAAIALDETIRILGAERAFLFLADGRPVGDGHPPQLVPGSGRDAEGNDLDQLVDYSASTVDRVRRSGIPVVITGTEDSTTLGQSVFLHGLRSIMVAPVQLDGRLLGVVYLDSRVAKGIFTPDDAGVLTAITNHIAVALETARAAQLEVAVAAANRQRDLAETLRDALAEITGTLQPEPESVLLRLRRTVVGSVGADRAFLVLGQPDGGAVRIHTSDTEQPSHVEPGPVLSQLLTASATVVGTSATGRPELLADVESCWLAIPLLARSEHLGLLLLASRDPHAYDDGRADLATALVGQAMVAYENARLFAQVQHLATTDDLTGVANRRHFFDLAARALNRARSDGYGLVAVMVDIDHFKAINDQYGHQVGDEVIQIVATRLNRFARAEDVLGRYGGEEFSLLMRGGGQDPGAAAERLRSAIADHPIVTRSITLTVTVSVGAAILRPEDTTVETFLGRADQRLYEAKRGGRNRVATD